MAYFSHQSAAQRYALGRPYVHPQVMDRVRRHLELANPVPLALDVGCGTGQSTVALSEIAERVVGTDIAVEMVRLAPRSDGTSYVVSRSEEMPFASGVFDLATVAMAFH